MVDEDDAEIGLELEKVLQNDHEGKERDRLCGEFQARADALKVFIDRGTSQTLYVRLERQLSGYLAAIETIRVFWEQTHKKV